MDNQVRELLANEVELFSYSGINGYGEKQFATGKLIDCLIYSKTVLLTDLTGTNVVSRQVLIIDAADVPTLNINDVVKLNGHKQNIASLEAIYDFDGQLSMWEVGL